MALLTQQCGSVQVGNTTIPLSPVTCRAQSPKDAGTQGGTLGPLHFAGNGSRKKTELAMALLVLIPAQGGEDWRHKKPAELASR